MDTVRVKAGSFITISKMDEGEQVVKGIVYKPNELDTYGDWMTATEIKKMAYDFMKNMNLDQIDTNHDLVNVEAYVCESYIAKSADPDEYPEGAWVVAVKVVDPEVWAGCLDGTYTGFSMFGQAWAIPDSEPII